MKSLTCRIISVVTGLMAFTCTWASEADTTAIIKNNVSFGPRGAWLMPSNEFFRGENKYGKQLNTSISIHMQYTFSFPTGSYFRQTFPTAYQGFGIAFNTFFDNKEIGSPAAIYLVQGAEIAKLSDRLSFGYEWNFGASFGWHPYKEFNGVEGNSYNIVVGSKINAYINMGLTLTWHPSDSWSVMAGAELSHFSNGNTKYPNAGVNTLGARIGAVYSFTSPSYRKDVTIYEPTKHIHSKKFLNRITIDAILYGAVRSKGMVWEDNPYIVSGKFGILGVNINPMYRVGKCFRAGFSIDIQYDESANISKHIAGHVADRNGEDLRFFRPPLCEQLGTGVSLRAELAMPIFSVNIGFGHNVLYKCDDLDGFYQVVALKADVSRHLFLHIGYKLSKFHDPNNLMIGAGWRFGDSRWNANDTRASQAKTL